MKTPKRSSSTATLLTKTAGVSSTSRRAQKGLLISFWPGIRIDKVDDDSIEFEYIDTMTLDDYDDVTGKKLISFKLFGETYRQNKFVFMLFDVIKLLDKRQPAKIEELARNNYSFNATKRKHVHLNTNGEGMQRPMESS